MEFQKNRASILEDQKLIQRHVDSMKFQESKLKQLQEQVQDFRETQKKIKQDLTSKEKELEKEKELMAKNLEEWKEKVSL